MERVSAVGAPPHAYSHSPVVQVVTGDLDCEHDSQIEDKECTEEADVGDQEEGDDETSDGQEQSGVEHHEEVHGGSALSVVWQVAVEAGIVASTSRVGVVPVEREGQRGFPNEARGAPSLRSLSASARARTHTR